MSAGTQPLAPSAMVQVAASMVREALTPGGITVSTADAVRWVGVLHRFAAIGAKELERIEAVATTVRSRAPH